MSVLSLKSTGWTESERRILDILQDCQPHAISECYDSGESPEYEAYLRKSTRAVVNRIRPKLSEHGMGVLVEYIKGEPHWRLVRFLSQEDL